MKKIVYLDPGHGGPDPGAMGPTGLRESWMALDVCLRAKEMLEPSVEVRLTREADEFVSLSGRAAMANRGGADVFVSYHFNSGSSPKTASSWEIFTTRGQNNSDRLATFIGLEHKALFPDQMMRADFSEGDLDKEANFAVLRLADCPAVLMEGEFIHTVHGEALIANGENRQKMALAVMRGVLKFLHLGEVPVGTLEERVERLERLVL